MKCEGCVHYRPFHGKPDSDEYECELGMAFAYECMSNGDVLEMMLEVGR